MIWLLWAVLLVAQNFAFTFVSRARNSASLTRHVVAALFSNGVWFASQVVVFGQMYKILSGAYGVGQAIGVGAFYTICTIVGSVSAHKFCLATEKGKSAVGAHVQYAQIKKEEWEKVKNAIGLSDCTE